MNRAQRRACEQESARRNREAIKAAGKQLEEDIRRTGVFDGSRAQKDAAYMARVAMKRLEERKRWEEKGISPADMRAEYEKGYAAGQKDSIAFSGSFLCAACAIALHRLYGFGETRIIRAIEEINRVILEEISLRDMAERLKRETGLRMEDMEGEL